MRASVFEDAGRVRVPVTIAWADRDRLVGPPKRVPPGARSVILHGCGHVPTWDDPEQVARVLLQGSSGDWQNDARWERGRSAPAAPQRSSQ
jgi:pimeloyl-ACP methyl ester carboxylesterase